MESKSENPDPSKGEPLVDESLSYTAPGLAAAHAMSEAFAKGSPKAKRKARILTYVVLGMIVISTGIPLLMRIVN